MKANNFGQMVVLTQESGAKVNKMEKESMSVRMALPMMEWGSKTKHMAMGRNLSWMGRDMLGIGLMTSRMDKEKNLYPTDLNMMGSTSTAQNMAEDY